MGPGVKLRLREDLITEVRFPTEGIFGNPVGMKRAGAVRPPHPRFRRPCPQDRTRYGLGSLAAYSLLLGLSLCVVRSLLDYLLNLLICKLHLGVLAGHVGSCPVEQFLVVVTFQILAAKTIECSFHMPLTFGVFRTYTDPPLHALMMPSRGIWRT